MNAPMNAPHDLLDQLGELAREQRKSVGGPEPLSDIARQRMLRAALAELPNGASVDQPTTARPRRPGLAWLVAGSGALAAAAAALFVFMPHGLGDLPEYRAEVVGGTSYERSAPPSATESATKVVSAASELEILVRPSTAVTEPVGAVAFATHEGATERWEAPIEVSQEGVVRVVGPARSLFQPPAGRWTLTFAVGRTRDLPARFEDVRPSDRVRVTVVDVTLAP